MQPGARGLARGFEDRAVGIEQPTVIATTDAMLGDDAVFQRRPTMAAVPVKHADCARFVTESDEILAHDANRQRQVDEFLRQTHRLPESPHVFAAGRARCDVGQLRIFSRQIPPLISGVRPPDIERLTGWFKTFFNAHDSFSCGTHRRDIRLPRDCGYFALQLRPNERYHARGDAVTRAGDVPSAARPPSQPLSTWLRQPRRQ